MVQEEKDLSGGVVTKDNLINKRQFEKVNGEWKLVRRRCKACESLFMFPKVTCPDCLAETEFDAVPFSGKGKLFCYTVVSVMPSGFMSPGIFAEVTLEEGPRILALLDVPDVHDQEIKIGMHVEMLIKEIRKDNDGNPLYCYVFVPAKNNGGC